MAVPKKRTTKSSRNQRRMHIFIQEKSLSSCPKCKQPVLPHITCSNCGFYKGVEVIDTLKRLGKKERKLKEKEIAAQEKEGKKEQKASLGNLSK